MVIFHHHEIPPPPLPFFLQNRRGRISFFLPWFNNIRNISSSSSGGPCNTLSLATIGGAGTSESSLSRSSSSTPAAEAAALVVCGTRVTRTRVSVSQCGNNLHIGEREPPLDLCCYPRAIKCGNYYSFGGGGWRVTMAVEIVTSWVGGIAHKISGAL